MVKKLTDKTIKSLPCPPPKGQRDYPDASAGSPPRFGIRVSYTGSKNFFLKYDANGRRNLRITLGRYPALGLADARGLAREAYKKIASGRDPQAEKLELRRAESFAELAQEYLERHAKPKKKSWWEDERIIKNELLPHWRNLKAKDIKRADVRVLLERITARPAPIQANRVLEIVRKMYNWGIQNDLVEVTPCYKLPKPNKEHQRDRVLTEDEIVRAWDAMGQESSLTAAIFKLMLVTAQRPIEVRSMRWEDIDGAWWTIPAEVSKNGLSHRVPLSPMALEILSEVEEKMGRFSEWVFPSPIKSGVHMGPLFTAFARARKRSAVSDFQARDLRRTAASMMTSKRIPRLAVQKILNHVEKGVTAVYDRHSYDEEKREALERWGQELERIVSGGVVLSFPAG